MAKKKKLKAYINHPDNPLTNMEWTTLWMSIRYAVGRSSGASIGLISDVIRNYYYRLSDHQRTAIIADIHREYINNPFNSSKKQGLKDYAAKEWIKFMLLLDTSKHFRIIFDNGYSELVFEMGDVYIPIQSYIEQPQDNVSMSKSDIKSCTFFNMKLNDPDLYKL